MLLLFYNMKLSKLTIEFNNSYVKITCLTNLHLSKHFSIALFLHGRFTLVVANSCYYVELWYYCLAEWLTNTRRSSKCDHRHEVITWKERDKTNKLRVWCKHKISCFLQIKYLTQELLRKPLYIVSYAFTILRPRKKVLWVVGITALDAYITVCLLLYPLQLPLPYVTKAKAFVDSEVYYIRHSREQNG